MKRNPLIIYEVVVIVKDENMPPMKLKLARITQIHPGNAKNIRVVTIRLGNGTEIRQITKLYKLAIYEAEEHVQTRDFDGVGEENVKA